MTSGALLRILGRRWYVIVVGLAVVAAVFVAMQRAGGAYEAQTSVVFVAPGNQAVGGVNDGIVTSMVDFAAVVERQFHDGRTSDRVGENATLYGEGVKKGYRVLLVNSGSQWVNSFAKPVLSIDVVGPSPGWVTSTLRSISERIDRIAARDQATAGVAPKNRITAHIDLSASEVRYVGGTRGTAARALIALLCIGLGAFGAIAVLLDKALHRHSKRTATRRTPRTRATRLEGSSA